MFWPILECSIVAAGLWFARSLVPDALAPYADVMALGAIVALFVWLARRALKRGAQDGINRYRSGSVASTRRNRAIYRTRENGRSADR